MRPVDFSLPERAGPIWDVEFNDIVNALTLPKGVDPGESDINIAIYFNNQFGGWLHDSVLLSAVEFPHNVAIADSGVERSYNESLDMLRFAPAIRTVGDLRCFRAEDRNLKHMLGEGLAKFITIAFQKHNIPQMSRE